MSEKSPDSVDVYVGSRVRSRRLMLKMSQGKLGERIGVTFQQVQKYEKGTNRVGSSRLLQLAHVLEVPVTYFFDGAPSPKARKPRAKYAYTLDNVAEFTTSREGVAFIESFGRIRGSRVRKAIVNLAKAIAGEEGRPTSKTKTRR